MKHDGGPAFPMTCTEWNRDREEWEVAARGGMSLRDYFAAAAVQGIMANEAHWKRCDDADRIVAGGSIAKQVAKFAYLVADAMVLEREQP